MLFPVKSQPSSLDFIFAHGDYSSICVVVNITERVMKEFCKMLPNIQDHIPMILNHLRILNELMPFSNKLTKSYEDVSKVLCKLPKFLTNSIDSFS